MIGPTRYSVRTIYDSKPQGRSGPHEVIISEVRTLMQFLEHAKAAA